MKKILLTIALLVMMGVGVNAYCSIRIRRLDFTFLFKVGSRTCEQKVSAPYEHTYISAGEFKNLAREISPGLGYGFFSENCTAYCNGEKVEDDNCILNLKDNLIIESELIERGEGDD